MTNWLQFVSSKAIRLEGWVNRLNGSCLYWLLYAFDTVAMQRRSIIAIVIACMTWINFLPLSSIFLFQMMQTLVNFFFLFQKYSKASLKINSKLPFWSIKINILENPFFRSIIYIIENSFWLFVSSDNFFQNTHFSFGWQIIYCTFCRLSPSWYQETLLLKRFYVCTWKQSWIGKK